MGLVTTLSLNREPGVSEVLGGLHERFPPEYVSMLPVAVEAMGMLGHGTAGADVKGVVLEMLSASLRSSRAAKYLSAHVEDVTAEHLYTLSQAYRQALAQIDPDRIRWALDPVAQREQAGRWAAGLPALAAALEGPFDEAPAGSSSTEPNAGEQALPAPSPSRGSGRRRIRRWIAQRRRGGPGRR
jgi:hypothetical protein